MVFQNGTSDSVFFSLGSEYNTLYRPDVSESGKRAKLSLPSGENGANISQERYSFELLLEVFFQIAPAWFFA
ncbi:hypothetical protein LEP1GSC188_3119 [Leptospira weilii serovar Topaz str. LT2116]|uniref:Uncharacterized protein n=1 Tax=Leptospira weilii serovar Topaz str. LT2116 TaxID=1088540 RepID=M3GVF7_9LEPT|nr:hypothetical protein LEP1GSC188_3119 [Leptospira weilii serovar Topaz str. LT2116]